MRDGAERSPPPLATAVTLAAVDGDGVLDRIGQDAGGGRLGDARQDADIEQLADLALEPDPMDDVARFEIDDVDAAPGVGIAALQLVVER